MDDPIREFIKWRRSKNRNLYRNLTAGGIVTIYTIREIPQCIFDRYKFAIYLDRWKATRFSIISFENETEAINYIEKHQLEFVHGKRLHVLSQPYSRVSVRD